MNKRQVTLLWLVAIALGGALYYVKFGPQKTTASGPARAAGATLFEDFPATAVAAIDIQGAGDSATSLVKKEGKWTVAQRDDYPANVATVNGFLRTLEELKVTQAIQAGSSFAPQFGLDETATTVEKRGLTTTFKDATGRELVKIAIDQRKEPEDPTSPYGGGVKGRFIRNYQDNTGIYRVSESFGTLTDDPKRWLAEDFIQVEKIKAITVTQPDQAEVAWKLTRDTEEGPFVLAGAAPGETLDTTATDPLKSLLSYARIDDVIPAAKVAERIQGAGKRTATIETFEGFVYTINILPTKATPVLPAAIKAATQPPATDNVLMTVSVTAELPKERKKEEGEKPEDAKTKDTAFTQRLKTLTERLAKEQALANRTFEVSKYTVEPLLKERSTLIKKDAPATPATPGSPAIPGAGQPTPTPTGPIEAVTPPIAVPPLPAEEPKQPTGETPKTEPAGQPAVEPAKEPATEPAKEPAKEPAAEPAKQPAAEPAKEPAAEPAKEPAAEPAKEPAKEQAAEPAKEPAAEPAKEPAAEPAKEPAKEPAAEPAKEPAKEPVAPPAGGQ